MRFASSVVLVVGVCLTGAGCRESVAADQGVLLGVTKLEAPATVSPNSALTVVLTVETSGCIAFDRIEMVRGSRGAFLSAWGKQASVPAGSACMDIAFSTPHSVQFDPPFEDHFFVQVQRGRVSPLVATVQVQ